MSRKVVAIITKAQSISFSFTFVIQFIFSVKNASKVEWRKISNHSPGGVVTPMLFNRDISPMHTFLKKCALAGFQKTIRGQE